MTTNGIVNLGHTGDKQQVFLDYKNTHVEYHLLETPNLIDLVREVLPTIESNDEKQVIVERDLGRPVGTTNLVETASEDEIVYAKRIGRNEYSRFVKNRELLTCSSIVVVLRKGVSGYFLWTAMCGRLLPDEAYQKYSDFNKTHAMVYDEQLIQLDTVVQSQP
jgi:hypothetical protein